MDSTCSSWNNLYFNLEFFKDINKWLKICLKKTDTGFYLLEGEKYLSGMPVYELKFYFNGDQIVRGNEKG